MSLAFGVVAAGVVFAFTVALLGVLAGQMFDALIPPLSYIPLGATLLIATAAAAAAFGVCQGRRR